MRYNYLSVLNADYTDLTWRINPDTADTIDENGTMYHNAGVQYPDDFELVEVDDDGKTISARLGKDDLPSKAELDAKIKNYNEVVEPARLMREERNRLIQDTDLWVLPDRIASQEQLDYRKALRDLPSTASPQLDEHGKLTNVTWPTPPS